MPRIFRVVRAGVAAALIVGVTGFSLERARFGPSDQSALARVEAELRQRFDASAVTLGAIAARLAAEPDTARAAPRDQTSVKRLFDLVTEFKDRGPDADGQTYSLFTAFHPDDNPPAATLDTP